MKQALTVLIGISGGLAVGGSIAAFLTVLGVVNRAIECTRTKGMVRLYEVLIVFGAFGSALVYFFDITLHATPALLLPIGLFMGIFVGFIAGALTETLDILSTAAGRMGILRWIYALVFIILLGKTLGSLLFFLFPGFF